MDESCAAERAGFSRRALVGRIALGVGAVAGLESLSTSPDARSARG